MEAEGGVGDDTIRGVEVVGVIIGLVRHEGMLLWKATALRDAGAKESRVEVGWAYGSALTELMAPNVF